MQPNPAIFAPILIAALVLFAVSCWRRFSLVAMGRPEDRFHRLDKRIGDMLLYAFGQKKVVQKPFGANHFVIFWAFMILLLANGEFLVNGVFPGFSLAFLPAPLHHGLLVAFFGLHGAEIAQGNDEGAAWMPLSSFVAGLLDSAAPAGIAAFGAFCWWIHAIVLLLFMNYLPHSKHMHILTAIPNCFFQSLEKPNTQPREEFATGNVYGAGEVTRLTSKDLFDSYSCTECGRCQNACPATNTGKELNPRQVVHDIKVNLLGNAALLKIGEKPLVPLIGDQGEGSVSEESIWACTTCGACMEACPVQIEQMPKIIKMRRHLVETEAKFPEELLNLFENMEGRSNPWGIAPSERTKWCSTMDVKPFEKDVTEYLFFVGCSGSFDSRQKHVTVALATILDAAGISWGTLGKDEKCCGDSLRRLGNEFVFDKIARENVQTFQERGVRKVIVQCPHCFSTLKNDYRQYGLELEVIHHSELLDELLKSGRLKLNQRVTELGRIVFHDSCYLGRHNDIYESPREAIRLATGAAPAEMERNRNNAFCCGAGGGRMWMEEFSGTRINLARVEEALETKPDTVCVSCPYCMTMFEDGLKDKEAGGVRVRDIAEVVAEGLRGQEEDS